MSTAGPGPHPTPEELDELAGAPSAPSPPSESTESTVSAHVAACPTCRATLAGVRAVRERLRAEGAVTPPVPADVQRRVADALERESAFRSVPSAATPLPSGTRSRVPARPPRWLAAAAALIVLGGAAVTATQLLDPPAEQAASTQAEGQPEPQQGGDDAADGGAQSGGPTPSRGPQVLGDAGALVVPVATGTDYTPARLAAQVDALLAGAGTGAAGVDGAPRVDAAAPGLGRAADLAACLRALGDDATAPLAVDLARWQGQAAAVVVAPLAGAGPDVQVFVVGRGCGDGDVVQLRHTARVDR